MASERQDVDKEFEEWKEEHGNNDRLNKIH